MHLTSLSFKVPEVQKKATFEERVLITEERISVAIPEEIPSPEGTHKQTIVRNLHYVCKSVVLILRSK